MIMISATWRGALLHVLKNILQFLLENHNSSLQQIHVTIEQYDTDQPFAKEDKMTYDHYELLFDDIFWDLEQNVYNKMCQLYIDWEKYFHYITDGQETYDIKNLHKIVSDELGTNVIPQFCTKSISFLKNKGTLPLF